MLVEYSVLDRFMTSTCHRLQKLVQKTLVRWHLCRQIYTANNSRYKIILQEEIVFHFFEDY